MDDNELIADAANKLLKLDAAMVLVSEAFNRGEVLIEYSSGGAIGSIHAAGKVRITAMKHKRMEPK